MLTKIKQYIAGLVEWSTRKRGEIDDSKIEGIVSRNYRTWIGHSTVTTGAVAAGKVLALAAAIVDPVIGVTIILVFLLAANGFYFNREFGPKGNYYEAKDLPTRREAKDKRLDSIGDFMIPAMLSVFSLANLPLIASVIMFATLFGSMVLLKDDEVPQ